MNGLGLGAPEADLGAAKLVDRRVPQGGSADQAHLGTRQEAQVPQPGAGWALQPHGLDPAAVIPWSTEPQRAADAALANVLG